MYNLMITLPNADAPKNKKWGNMVKPQNEIEICSYCGPGGRLNKKDGLTGYGDSHVKDKTS